MGISSLSAREVRHKNDFLAVYEWDLVNDLVWGSGWRKTKPSPSCDPSSASFWIRLWTKAARTCLRILGKLIDFYLHHLDAKVAAFGEALRLRIWCRYQGVCKEMWPFSIIFYISILFSTPWPRAHRNCTGIEHSAIACRFWCIMYTIPFIQVLPLYGRETTSILCSHTVTVQVQPPCR